MLDSRSPSVVKWARPSSGFVKLNVDGSSLSNTRKLGGGGICRRDNGEFIFAFVVGYGIGSNTRAKLRAVYNSLRMCFELGHNRIEVESDCRIVVGLLHGSTDFSWRWENWFLRIGKLRASGSCSFHHVLREGNASADGMARLGSDNQLSFSTRHLADLPSKIKGLIFLDKVGLGAIRSAPL
ncbi:uncharacterized protein LOC131225027 [Magnolia sinica]|uniref:uncharacterized protein LOC131225027 n=1 Tax=Magnolia sinica TaxID=86752 RepID=UPI00265A3455|nr:uncharacterized protein LOC131225027 [Magnolia sinica]